jgi:hypothetical protein
MRHTSIFLGGTVGNSNWRTSFIADLVKVGVPEAGLFNPVVPNWTPECQAAEDEAKAIATFNLFYLTNPEIGENAVSVYSIVEAIMCLYDQPSNTVIVFDFANSGYPAHTLKALAKTEKDLRKRFPNANILGNREDALNFFIDRLAQVNASA